ncbi:hypothetical protein N7512_009815 [Penicillium capsulatum]|nr:hypothetical protein N7512_009815 [Penicillium capsulatum]
MRAKKVYEKMTALIKILRLSAKYRTMMRFCFVVRRGPQGQRTSHHVQQSDLQHDIANPNLASIDDALLSYVLGMIMPVFWFLMIGL